MTKKVCKERGNVLLERVKSRREMTRKNDGLRVRSDYNVTNQK